METFAEKLKEENNKGSMGPNGDPTRSNVVPVSSSARNVWLVKCL